MNIIDDFDSKQFHHEAYPQQFWIVKIEDGVPATYALFEDFTPI